MILPQGFPKVESTHVHKLSIYFPYNQAHLVGVVCEVYGDGGTTFSLEVPSMMLGVESPAIQN